MRHWILIVAVAVLAALARGQERVADVLLVDGQRFSGRVVAMDLDHVELAIGGKILTIASKNIKTCHITSGSEAAPGGESSPSTGAASSTRAPAAGEGAAPVGAPLAETGALQVPADDDPTPPDAEAGPLSRRGPTPPAIAAPETIVGDVAETSLIRARIAMFGRTLPWLHPSEPSQWISIAALLFAGLVLIIHSSARLVGAEVAPLGRSVGLALLYLIAAGLQIAWLPANDFTIFSALIGNSALVLYAVRKAFALPRSNTFVAVAIQVGFGMLGLSLLQLVDSLLGSVAV